MPREKNIQLSNMFTYQTTKITRLLNIRSQMMNSTINDSILFGKMGEVVTFKLNKPKALNALDQDMLLIIKNKVREWGKHNIPAVILSGEGEKIELFLGGKALSAGGDIKSLYFAKTSPSEIYPPSLLDSFFFHEYQADYALATMKPILIALMDGIVMGGGVGISINAPVRISTETSMFAMPEAKIGLFTDVAGGYFLSRLKNNIGMFIGLTGYRLKGSDLFHAGLADYFVPRNKLDSLVQEISQKITKQDQIKEVKDIVSKYQFQEVPDFSINQYDLQTIKEVFEDSDFSELLNKLKNHPNKEFSQKTLDILEQQCPISVRVIFEQLKRGKNLDLRENLIMDYRIVTRFMQGVDFSEGVKKVLIDKNYEPQWSFKVAKDIPQSEVEKYFAPLQKDLIL